jgi:hypothetical protein
MNSRRRIASPKIQACIETTYDELITAGICEPRNGFIGHFAQQQS